jgi:hypothetical protein
LTLVSFAVFVGFSVGLTFASGAPSGGASATSAIVLASQGTPEPGGLPPATPEQEQHGLSQKAVGITRIFGFPITNSMIVSWDCGFRSDHSSSVRYTEHEASP